jgi:hypothetical protein
VTFAIIGGMPSATSVGKVIKVPPPAKALIAPATNAARLANIKSNKLIAMLYEPTKMLGIT